MDGAGERRGRCRIFRDIRTTSTRSTSFPAVDDYTRGTRLELGDYDAARNDDKFKLRAFGDARLPIDDPLCRCLSVEERRQRQVLTSRW